MNSIAWSNYICQGQYKQDKIKLAREAESRLMRWLSLVDPIDLAQGMPTLFFVHKVLDDLRNA